MNKISMSIAFGLATLSAYGQGFLISSGAMSSPGSIVRRDDVRADLKLRDDQVKALQEMFKSLSSKVDQARSDDDGALLSRQKAMADIYSQISDGLGKILSPTQMKRLTEIRYQIGGFALIAADKDLQNSLSLSDEQKVKIAALAKKADVDDASIGDKMKQGLIDFPKGIRLMQNDLDILNRQIGLTITDEQEKKFKTLQGETFKETTQLFGH